MRILLLLAMVGVLSIGVAYAQDAHTSYFGIGVALLPTSEIVFPLASVQLGTPVADFVELRATLDTLVIVNALGADVLLTLKPGGGFKPYLGLGGLIIFPGTVTVDAVTTLGAEYAPGSFGFFGEARVSVISLASGYLAPYFRAGVNFHF